jgi:hypothetical protein
VPLFVLQGEDTLQVVSETDQFRLRPEHRLVALVATGPDARAEDDHQAVPERLPDDPVVFEVEEEPAGDGSGEPVQSS